jgi:hypothetical protein
MTALNVVAILVATAGSFVLSFGYYALFAGQMATLNPVYAEPGQPPPWKILVELGRNLVLASVVAGLVTAVGLEAAVDGLLLAVVLWIGFPIVLWVGAVMWERVPARLAAIHAGDWLLKLALVGVIATVWR